MRTCLIRLTGLFAVIALALATACSNPLPFKSKPLPDTPAAPAFTLTDQTGQPRSLNDFRGKVVSLFFGFTHCPDICPTHLARQAEVMRQLGSQADQLAVLFVTLDPERDLLRHLNATWMPLTTRLHCAHRLTQRNQQRGQAVQDFLAENTAAKFCTCLHHRPYNK